MNDRAMTFDFSEHVVRVVERDNGLWWVAADVCRALELVNTTDALKGLDDDDLAISEVIDSLGRKQQANTVSESGLYSLIFTSRKEKARDFKRWVTKEVLPAIRKHGRYEMSVGDEPSVFEQACEAMEGVGGVAAAAARRVLSGEVAPEVGQVVTGLCQQTLRAWECRLRIRPPVEDQGERALDAAFLMGIGRLVGERKDGDVVGFEEIALATGMGEMNRQKQSQLGVVVRRFRDTPLVDSQGRRFEITRRRGPGGNHVYAVRLMEGRAA